MDKLVVYNSSNVEKFINKRQGETKFGEHIKLLQPNTSIYDALKSLDVLYVLVGIPESVGVFANYGKTGAYKAWQATIKVLLNVQSNPLTHPEKLLLLGHLDFTDEEEQIKTLNQNKKKDLNKARSIVETIDTHVSHLMSTIVNAGKIPIAIGGGHNNAYGMIKGTSLALKKPINAINFDAHTDFRALEGRHSGNGFSYATKEGFLKNYFVFGLHNNYTSQPIFEQFETTKSLDFVSYEAMQISKTSSFNKGIKQGKNFVCKAPFGLELDCDSIINIPSSAMTPSGFSVEKARRFITEFAKEQNIKYLHICEAAPSKKQTNQVGKLITYLITDFIRAHGN
ncbi:formimidoylglutamase [Lacinutrix salivirga]